VLRELVGAQGQHVEAVRAEDAVSASWRFACGALGSGAWNFVADRRVDRVEIIGSQGRITFSVFDEHPLQLEAEETLNLFIDNPAHIQWHHVQGMNAHIRGQIRHPALASEALKTDRVMDRILQRG